MAMLLLTINTKWIVLAIFVKSWPNVESRTHDQKVASSSFGPAGIVGGGSECTALSPPSIPRRGALEQGTEPPTAPRVPLHKWLNTAPGVCVLMG